MDVNSRIALEENYKAHEALKMQNETLKESLIQLKRLQREHEKLV